MAGTYLALYVNFLAFAIHTSNAALAPGGDLQRQREVPVQGH